jgi:hypothetical protein
MMADTFQKDLLAYGAMGTLRAMAWHRPEELTSNALDLVRAYDHFAALEEDRERAEWFDKLREARA